MTENKEQIFDLLWNQILLPDLHSQVQLETCHQHKWSLTSVTNIDVATFKLTVTSMLVTDFGDQMVTCLRCWWPIKYIEKITNITKKVANIMIHIMSPTSLSPQWRQPRMSIIEFLERTLLLVTNWCWRLKVDAEFLILVTESQQNRCSGYNVVLRVLSYLYKIVYWMEWIESRLNVASSL